MTAVNAGIHEVAGVRLPLQPYSGGHAVFMYSTAADGNVTLQLKEPDDLDRGSLAAMLARLQDDATFSISYQDTDILSDGSIDVLLGTGSNSSLQATVSSTDDKKGQSGSATAEVMKLSVKRARPKAASPNRQGPQQCQVCAKVFGNASALAKHKLTHSDERKYVCTMCGKAFKRQDHLNGHMLTHRNKKPYECKAEGCGKSYCDARSLRRHTENHHSSSSSSSSSSSTSSSSSSTAATTMSPAQGAASGDAASPHGSSCIQYAPPPTTTATTGKSQLQQLLATEPAKGGSGGNNDGLTKQQLDLIHQIMEQTQRQSQTSTKSSGKASKPSGKSPSKVQRVWTTNAQNGSNKSSTSSSSQQSKVTTTAASSTSPTNSKTEPKPVECNLCHRKFKNIPALNGHMRLHGGYFKKDADNKKCEKKDTAGPPLQTASVSVRALIEEKIINKRITNPTTATTNSSEEPRTTAPPLFPLTVHSTGSTTDTDTKISSFVVPAPPPQPTADKTRRHSDAEAFSVPKTPTPGAQSEADALADLILKREKVTVERTVSDPGQIVFQSGDSFTLTYPAEDGYLSPSLQDEVFTQVQDSMLLQGVDAQQLASIQFQTDALLQDQNDHQLHDIALDDYASLQETVVQSPSYQSNHSVNQDLQAVLDSPLPESLAEFSTFHSTGNLDIPSPSYQTQSPAQFSNSPHASLATRSPLQSPLIRHDSPGFAYPTPPASHEGQSPCFTQTSLLPMVSPKQEFNPVINTDLDEPPQASSPLSAAFFTSTMSSSAAVEEALEEVLPGESISADELYPSLTNSPPPPSPLSVGLTPAASPLSNIASTSTATSPHTHTTYTSPNPISFSMSPHYTLQSQMLPNSDDPLLSSSPKDFPARKKFEFNGLPLKVIGGNGLIDINNTNLTGILVETNGEIKFIQTNGAAFPGKNILLTSAPIIAAQTASKDEQKKAAKGVTAHTAKQTVQTARPKTEHIKAEPDVGDVFLSPTTIPSSPVRASRKRPRSEPLQLPVLHQSRLRATRSKPPGAAPFTPLPILNPNRPGSGLYFYLKQKCSDNQEQETYAWNNESVPETDSTPHINVGPQFQCHVPPFTPAYSKRSQERTREDLLWDPGILQCTEAEVDMYLDFACCAAVPGGGRNQEYAMHLLHMCSGNIHEAMLKLMQPTPVLPPEHPLLHYPYSESDKWTSTETEMFYQAIQKHDKDFFLIAQDIGTKSVKQCVQFYYTWKKVCTDEYRRLKHTRGRRHGLDAEEEKPYPDAKLLGIADTGSPMPIPEHRNFICEFPECSASFNSRAALNGHIRIHGGTARNSPTPAQILERRASAQTAVVPSCHTDSTEDYPCKICGKVFTKIKSRSAHMKSHRPPDADTIKKREKEPVSSTTFDSVPSPFNT